MISLWQFQQINHDAVVAVAKEAEQVVQQLEGCWFKPPAACQSVFEQDTGHWWVVGTFCGSFRHQCVNVCVISERSVDWLQNTVEMQVQLIKSQSQKQTALWW